MAFGGMGSYPPSGPSKLNITAARKPNPVGKVFLSFVTDPELENSSGRAFLFRKLQMGHSLGFIRSNDMQLVSRNGWVEVDGR